MLTSFPWYLPERINVCSMTGSVKVLHHKSSLFLHLFKEPRLWNFLKQGHRFLISWRHFWIANVYFSWTAVARYNIICSDEEICKVTYPFKKNKHDWNSKSINWSHSFPVQLKSWTTLRLPTISPILFITWWFHTSSRITFYSSNDPCTFANTSTAFHCTTSIHRYHHN